MGYYAHSAKASAVPLPSLSQELIIREFTIHCDDRDDSSKGMERGKNSFPSLHTIAKSVGVTVRNVRKNVSDLIDMGFLRENPTARYRIYASTRSGSAPLCREVNLSMLARLMDVRRLVDKWNIIPGDKRYIALVKAALTFCPDDWNTRIWHIDYKAMELDWDGELDSISPALWDTKDTPEEEKSSLDDGRIQGTMSEEELEPYTNNYRIDL